MGDKKKTSVGLLVFNFSMLRPEALTILNSMYIVQGNAARSLFFLTVVVFCSPTPFFSQQGMAKSIRDTEGGMSKRELRTVITRVG